MLTAVSCGAVTAWTPAPVSRRQTLQTPCLLEILSTVLLSQQCRRFSSPARLRPPPHQENLPTKFFHTSPATIAVSPCLRTCLRGEVVVSARCPPAQFSQQAPEVPACQERSVSTTYVKRIVKPKFSPKSRSQIQVPNPNSKIQRKGTETGADTIILQTTQPTPPHPPITFLT